MRLKLIRDIFTSESTTGLLLIEETFNAYTLEDVARDIKIPGETCIPEGEFEILLYNSPKFGRMLPILQNVPNYKYVLMHPGNSKIDTDGCILPGMARSENWVSASKLAFDPIFDRIEKAISVNERVSIKVMSVKL